jgi:hypothetical protein
MGQRYIGDCVSVATIFMSNAVGLRCYDGGRSVQIPDLTRALSQLWPPRPRFSGLDGGGKVLQPAAEKVHWMDSVSSP